MPTTPIIPYHVLPFTNKHYKIPVNLNCYCLFLLIPDNLHHKDQSNVIPSIQYFIISICLDDLLIILSRILNEILHFFKSY